MEPTPAGPAGRRIAIALGASFVLALIGSSLWALSGRRTHWASEVKARFDQVEVARDAHETERAARRQTARDEAIAALDSLVHAASSDPDEVTRLRGAAKVLEQMSAEHHAPDAPRDGASLLATQPMFDLLPPPDHAELEAVLTDKLAVMEGVVAKAETPDADALAYLAYLRLHRGDRSGAVAASNQALLASPAMWLAWLVRGQALGAESDLLLADALCPKDPSWAWIAREALDLGHVPARYGHAAALKARVARLDAAAR